MRGIIFIILLAFLLFGCGEKQEIKYKYPPPQLGERLQQKKKTKIEPHKIDSSLWAHFHKIPSDPLVIRENQLDSLVPEILIIHDSNDWYKFRKIEVIGFELTDAPDKIYEYGEDKLKTGIDGSPSKLWGIYRRNQICKMPGDTSLLVLFSHAFGYESIPNVFAYFQKHQDTLIFKYFLKGVYDGWVTLDSLIQVAPNLFLMIGRTERSEGGVSRQKLWYEKWDLSPELVNLYENSYRFIHEYQEMKFERMLDTARGIAVICKFERKVVGHEKHSYVYAPWDTVEVDTLNYAALF